MPVHKGSDGVISFDVPEFPISDEGFNDLPNHLQAVATEAANQMPQLQSGTKLEEYGKEVLRLPSTQVDGTQP